MATTPNLGLELPTVGGDNDTWGDETNANWALLDQIIADRMYPIGSVHITTVNEDPSVTLGFGEWEAHAEGRALVGVGTADGETWNLNGVKGQATITLTEAEMPTHGHTAGTLETGTVGGHSHGPGTFVTSADGTHSHAPSDTTSNFLTAQGAGTNPGYNNGIYYSNVDAHSRTADAGAHTHTITGTAGTGGSHSHGVNGTTETAGSGDAHSNIQPSMALFVWKRTA